jgi:L,D-transpeptidase ErfK/SrfK
MGETAMNLIISVLLSAFLFLFSASAVAQPYGAKLCKNDSNYTCYKVKRGDSWAKLFPDEDERDLITRINRTNNKLYSGMLLAIPKDNTLDPLDYAPFNRQIEAPGEKVIIVSLDKLAFGAYNSNGELEYWGPVSGGKGYCPDIGRRCNTARGNFEIYRKMGAGCVSTKFPVGRGGAPMPYCMFFKGGFALHGSHDIPGYNASHGCVRLFVKDAKWLNLEFVMDDNVPVIVK